LIGAAKSRSIARLRGEGTMALKVVGSGFGRTGTNSLKLALEQLGLGPCHHMYEVRDHPEQLPHWHAAAEGGTADWDAVYAGYASAVDWPTAFYWRELAAHYADAKIIHTVRPEAAWLESFRATIHRALSEHEDAEPGNRSDLMNMSRVLITQRTFAGTMDDDAHVLSVYRDHNAAVRGAIPAERLLVFDVAHGWGPLCDFLGLAVPDTPFPHVNSSRQFNADQDDAGKWE
jgi:hypothetical protein